MGPASTIWMPLLSELCENFYAHSGFVTPEFISAGFQGERCEIAIAHSGMGIYQSYME